MLLQWAGWNLIFTWNLKHGPYAKKKAVARHRHLVRQRSEIPLALAYHLARPVVPPPPPSPEKIVNFYLCLAVVCGWNGAYSTTDIIKREICEKYGITKIELEARRRDTRTVQPRHEAFWRMRGETTLSLPDIGRLFGGFDHTTVLHGSCHYEKYRSYLRGHVPAPKRSDWDLSKIITEDA